MTMTMRTEWLEKDYYAILGVAVGASPLEITKAYWRLARRWHPDTHPDDPTADRHFQELCEAHAVLAHPDRRSEYDHLRTLASACAEFSLLCEHGGSDKARPFWSGRGEQWAPPFATGSLHSEEVLGQEFLMSQMRAGAPDRRLTMRWWGPPPRDREIGGVVVTGVFDILHTGHVRFLTWAANRGRPLYVGLEDDHRVRAMKGRARPINSLSDRAEVIASLRSVDAVFVISGPPAAITPQDYVYLLASINTAAIAFTAGDPHADEKRAGAAALGADAWEFPFEIGYSSSAVIGRALSGRGADVIV